MSEVTGSSSSQRATPVGPEQAPRVSHPGRKKPQTGQEQEQKPAKPSAETQSPGKSHLDPAVAVSPTLLALKIGDHLSGAIKSIDEEGRPLFETRSATFALRPDAGLEKGDRVLIRVISLDRKLLGELLEQNLKALEVPVELSLTLVGLKHGVENLTEAVRAEVPYGPGLPPESAAGPVATAPALETGPDAVPFSGLAAGSIIAGIPRVESQGASEVLAALSAPTPLTAFKAPHQSSPQTAIATVLSASESVAPKAVAGGQEFVALATGVRLGAQLLVPSTYTGIHAALRHLGPGSTVTLLNLGQESPAAGSPSALTLTGIVIDRTALTSLGIPVPESDGQHAEATSLASGKGGARNVAPVAGDQTGQVQYLSTQAGIFSIHPPVELAIGSTLHLAIEEPGTG
ncbi:MAG: hypothetical protein V3R73_00800, partial [Sphingomonadales bacterium]